MMTMGTMEMVMSMMVKTCVDGPTASLYDDIDRDMMMAMMITTCVEGPTASLSYSGG